MALTLPPPIPQRGDRATFGDRLDAFLRWLGGLVTEFNTAVAALSSWLAGGAYSIPYAYASAVSAVGKAAGGRLAPSGAQILLDTKDAAGASVGIALASFNSSTSAVRGTIRIQKQSDVATWARYSVTSYTPSSDGLYGTINVAPLDSSGVFTDSDALLLFFQRNGDKGDQGVAPITHVREEQVQGGQPASMALISTGVYQRTLNTVKTNDIPGITLTANRVNAPAGKFHLRAAASVGVLIAAGSYGRHKTAVYNITDSKYEAMGPGVGDVNPSTSGVVAYLPISQAECVLSYASAKVFEVRTILDGAALQNGGATVGSNTGVVGPEVYTEFIFEKI